MNFLKKYKQLVVGVLIGSMVAGVGVASADQTISAYLSASKFKFNGVEKQVPAGYAVLNYNGRTYVPARFVAEQLGANVDWDATTSTVIINGKTSTNGSHTPTTPEGLRSVVVNKTISSGPMTMKIYSVSLDPAFKKDQYSSPMNAIIFDVEIENTSEDTVNWYPVQGTIVLNTKEQIEKMGILYSEHVDGAFVGRVVKKGKIVFKVNSNLSEISNIKYKINGASNDSFDRVGEDTITELSLN